MTKHKILAVLFWLGLIVSAIEPHDYFTWILEVFPAIIAFFVLAVTYRRFKLTDLTYVFILIHGYILFIGGHYTYAEVPLFNWIRDTFHLARNDYDKVGHLAQGFIPAMVARELFIRRKIVKPGVWTGILTVAICGAISALYELLEWFVAIVSGQSAEAFLGTQGDPWDTQSDMFCAFIGASCMLILMSRIQNRQIQKLDLGL